MRSERKAEITAVFIMALWILAWVNSAWFQGSEIPGALNIIMPVASGVLLGVRLPIDIFQKRNGHNGS